MSFSFHGWNKLSKGTQRAWKVGGGIFAAGIIFKTAYFQFSRGLMVSDMDARHLRATKSLQESRDFGDWAAKDRKERAIPLTTEQRQQLREYLALMAEHNPDVYPNKSESMKRRRRKMEGERSGVFTHPYEQQLVED
mmetsp:Transcript_11887/g.16425  ORF Transcript_11887/g.16425 Transcript_11887/m.16425 type:complete len:137 (-) Transcript_11887:385-795(-)|eukprot:CAMPEP_0185724766 /NCGR_PEP_ID=MMETSP1171-20130828/1155_1 /TAXON_ID=374046 /ORGANISM="Helicotheca tamensis, Strain CCMP826" /LENGTH=136 /DNA_ID=CAMNT_0028392695 /DNA_START=153 /DNA_END=563 /DNA_ORIENTATION=-